MFCQKCGNSLAASLKYCNNCGNRVAGEVEDKDGTPGKMLDNVLTTLFLIVMFGLGILVGLVAVLLGSGVTTEIVMITIIVYLAAVFGICFSLVRQVPKLIDARLKASGFAANEPVQPAMLNPRTTAQLEEFRTPVASVTDHTTRTLEKVPVAVAARFGYEFH
ncbi:MAG: zinc ribbon domain-containing protein [Pyrinomonadaceae bacterium]